MFPIRYLPCFLVGLLGCGGSTPHTPPSTQPKGPNTGYHSQYPNLIQFPDVSDSNTKVESTALDLNMVDHENKAVQVKDYRGKKNVVLVFVRGFPGGVCLYCSTQTARMITNHDKFLAQDAAVLVVFPGPADHINDFVESVKQGAGGAKIPFPLLLDKDFKAVEKLGIRGQLAKPSTYILDKEGQVRFSYVGATLVDRPSVDSLLKQLETINKK